MFQEKLVESFKKGGLDKSTALRVLDVWKETGASDEEGLKRLLVRRCAFYSRLHIMATILQSGVSPLIQIMR